MKVLSHCVCTYIHLSCALDTESRGGVRVEVGGVNDTETKVTGLTPFVYYTFSVTAENAVSSQDINVNARTVRVTATTEEGGMSHTYLAV